MYKEYGQWLTSQIGTKTQKISINAGFTCPNRDGLVGTGGCTYCNNQTFNPAYCRNEKSVKKQLEEGKEFFARKYPHMKYLAYFQAYTNTYAPLQHLKNLYEEALGVKDIVGLVIGTRPDCMSEPLLNFLEHLNHKTFILIEYGIESIYDHTLLRINRGHDFNCTRQAIIKTAERDIRVGGHLIMGLPGETIDDMLNEADVLSKLPLTTMKLHQLQLIKGTKMEQEFQTHPTDFIRFTPESYADLVVKFIRRSRTDLVFERFVSQSPADLLVQPGWGLKNYEFAELVRRKMAE